MPRLKGKREDGPIRVFVVGEHNLVADSTDNDACHHRNRDEGIGKYGDLARVRGLGNLPGRMFGAS